MLDEKSSEARQAKNWFNSLTESEKETLLSVLMTRVENATTKEENSEFIKAGEEYLFVAPVDDVFRGDILEMLGQIYSDERNSERLESVRARLSSYAANNGEEYDSSLKKLKLASNSMKPMSKDMDGVWVSSVTDDMNYPLYIIDINSNTATLLPQSHNYSIRCFTNNPYAGLNKSQQFELNDNTGQYSFSFFSQIVKAGSSISNAMYDFSQATGRANAEYMAQSGVSISDKLGSTLASALISSIFEGIGDELAKARSTADFMNFSGHRVSSGYLTSHMEHITVNAVVETEKSTSSSLSFHFYRADPEDHVVFAHGWDGGVSEYFQLENATEKDAKEICRLKRKGWTVPLIAFGATAAVCGGILAFGLTRPKVEEYDSMGKPYMTMSKQGIAWTAVGIVSLAMSVIIPATVHSFTGPKAFRDFNKRQMNKLKNKYDGSISAVPMYDPFTQTGGASLAMTF